MKYYQVCEDCGSENQVAYDRGCYVNKDNCKYCSVVDYTTGEA
jgi:hypothetical protein